MNKKLHNKLVRDNIPEYLKGQGVESEIEVIDDDARLFRLLIDKLEEEAQEAGVALEDKELLDELADVESVIDGILKLKGWTRKELITAQEEKDAKRGRYDKKIFLISTTEEEAEPEDDEEEEDNN